jgi:spore maturation protein CgeB
MRLVLFGLSITSSWGNGHATTYRGLVRGLRQLGHRVAFFERDAAWYAAHRDLPHPAGVELTLYRDWPEVRAAALRAAGGADAVIVGSYYPDAIALGDALLGRAGPPVCFYDIDTPVTLAALRRGECAYLRAEQIPAFDLYLSFTGGPVLTELEHTWRARQVRPLYCACDESAYRAAVRAKRAPFALTFLGTFAPDRQAKLQRYLLEPARRMPHERFRLAGSMYPTAEGWPANLRYDTHLAPGDHPGFYAGSRFTLNLTRQAMVEAGYSPSVRLFEAAAAATPILTDPWPGLEQFFQPGRDILVATGSDDIRQAVAHASSREREALGRAAQARVLDAHTCRHRAAELAGYLAGAGRSPRAAAP